MPIQELYANSTLIVLAGSESTASGLAGITFNLLKNPAAFQKAVAEVREAFSSEQDIEPETVKRLPYLAAIVSEGLRMYPPFPEGLPRLTPRQGAVICGHWVPGGVSFFFFFFHARFGDVAEISVNVSDVFLGLTDQFLMQDICAAQHPRGSPEHHQLQGSRRLRSGALAWRSRIRD